MSRSFIKGNIFILFLFITKHVTLKSHKEPPYMIIRHSRLLLFTRNFNVTFIIIIICYNNANLYTIKIDNNNSKLFIIANYSYTYYTKQKTKIVENLCKY